MLIIIIFLLFAFNRFYFLTAILCLDISTDHTKTVATTHWLATN